MRFDFSHLIPPDLGVVRSGEEFGDDSPFVVYFNEAHGNRTCIRFEAEMIGNLIRETSIDLICIEAQTGEIPADSFRRWRNNRGRYSNPARMVEKGELDLFQYLYLTLDKEFEIYGVEDRSLYVKVNEKMKRLIPDRDRWDKLSAGLLADLQGAGLASVSPEYAEFFRTCGPEAAGGFPPVELIIGYAERCGIEPDELQNYRAIVDTKQRESSIDFEAANAEAQELQLRISQAISDGDQILLRSFESAELPVSTATPGRLVDCLNGGGFERRGLAARMARTSAGRLLAWARKRAGKSSDPQAAGELFDEYRSALAEFARETVATCQVQNQGHAALGALFNFMVEFFPLLGIDAAKYPNVVRYTQYLNRFLSANMYSTIGEMEALKTRIITRLAKTPADRLHAGLCERLALVNSMARLQQTRGDVKRVQSSASEMEHERLHSDLAQFIPDSPHLGEFRDVEDEYEERFDDTMTYFSLMISRANAMAENTLARMFQADRNSAILITGGFHTETITANLARQRVSYAVVLPMINRETSQSEMQGYYDTLLKQDLGGGSPSVPSDED